MIACCTQIHVLSDEAMQAPMRAILQRMDRDILDAGQHREPWRQLVELFDDSKSIYSPPDSIPEIESLVGMFTTAAFMPLSSTMNGLDLTLAN